MADLLYTSIEEYSTPDYVYKGKPGMKLNVSTSLAVAKTIRIKKIVRPIFNLVVSEQIHTSVVGVSALYMATSASKHKLIRKEFVASLTPEVWEKPVKDTKKNLSVALTVGASEEIAGEIIADAYLSSVAEALFLAKRVKSADTSLTANKSKFIKKNLQAVFSIDAYSGAHYIAETTVQMYLGASKQIFINKSAVATINLSPSIIAEKANKFTFEVYPDLAAAISKLSRRTFSRSVILSSQSVKMTKKVFNSQISLSTDTTFSIGKLLSATTYLSGATARTVEGVANAITTVYAQANKKIKKILSSTMTLDGESEQGGGLVYNAHIHLTSDIYAYIKKTLSAILTLSSSEEDYSGKKWTFASALSLAAAKVYKKANKIVDSDIILAVGKEKHVKKVLSVSVNMSASESEEAKKYEVLATTFLLMAGRAEKLVRKVLSGQLDISSEFIGGGGIVSEVNISLGASKSILVKKTSNVVIGMVGAGAKEIEATANVAINITGAAIIGGETIFISGLSIGASKTIFVKKLTGVTIGMLGAGAKEIEATANVTISIAGRVVQVGQLTANASLSLVPSISILTGNKVMIDTWMTFMPDPVKFIGKTFKIREHSPSVAHIDRCGGCGGSCSI